MDALASLCPHCYSERRRVEREQEQPETHTVEVGLYEGSLYAQRMWEQQKQLRIQAGEVLSETPQSERRSASSTTQGPTRSTT
jgi:hypothetical protein